MATKSQLRRAAQVEARLRKTFPEVFVVGVSVDDDGWLRGYLRPVDGGPFARELWNPAMNGLTVAQLAEVVAGWVRRELPKLEAAA